MKKKQIGEVTHYFNKIAVAVVKLSGNLKVGDKIEFEAVEPFQQMVDSMQVEHQNIAEAKAGKEIGLKVDKPVQKGHKVHKITE